jgi:cytoskeletal protein CcmA (bactofilin family)
LATLYLIALLSAGMLLAFAPVQTNAAELRQGDTIVVGPGETIDDDLYAFGQTVTIQGTVNGDVIAAGQSVTVAGTVNGDLMAAGTSVSIGGPIAGAARVAGQTVQINAPIAHDLLAGAATLDVGSRAAVGRDLLVGASSATVGGPVGRSIRAGTETLTIGGPVGGDVLAHVGTLRIEKDAAIQGSLTYTSNQDAVIHPQATVWGATTRLPAAPASAEPSPAARFGQGVLAWFQTLIGLSMFGLTVVLLFPGFSQQTTNVLTHRPWASLGFGFAVLVGMPLAAMLLFVLGLLIGGWWLGLLALALYIGLLPVAYTMVGLYVGRFIMVRTGRPSVGNGWALLTGLLALGLVSVVPLVGGVVLFAALLFGLGAVVQAVVSIHRARTEAADPPPARLEDPGEPIARLAPTR